jgi:hypothetical protein
MTDEAYVKQFSPRAEVRTIEPKKDHRFVTSINMSKRYFIGTFHGDLVVAIHSGSMQSPEDAWKDAQKKILRFVLSKFEQ